MFDDLARPSKMVDCRRWDTIQQLAEEKTAIGYYLSDPVRRLRPSAIPSNSSSIG